MADVNKITQIYDLQIVGYESTHEKFQTLVNDLERVRAAKIALNNEKGKIIDPALLTEINKKLTELTASEEKLSVASKKRTDNSISEYGKLNTAYLKARDSAAEMVKQYGIESEQAKTAAASAKLYKDQLIAINTLVKSGGATPGLPGSTAAGSYAETYAQYKQLYALLKSTPAGSAVNFQGENLGFDQAIAKLKLLATAEQDFRRQFAKDGLLVAEYTSGIVKAFKDMGASDLIGGQVAKANQRLEQLNLEFEKTRQELNEIKVTGARGFENLEKQLIANRNEALALQKQVGSLQAELRGAGDIGDKISQSIGSGFRNAKDQIEQLLVSYVGIQAAFQAIQSGVGIAKELSDQTTNLEVELGKAAGGAGQLVDQLSKLDTRTKLTTLEDIANIAAKAGVSESNLVGVTQALDKIKIAFGKDFGDVETGTESLVKLINVFEGTDKVNGDTLLRAGNAIRTLANESVASVPFLNDFAKRMAGLKGIADISLPSVLGLASGFEQFGQSSEVAGTVLTRVIPKLATNTEKYGQIAGLTQQAFADLLKNNPAEALIKVSEGLVKGKDGIEEISTAFADSNLGSGRIAAILGAVGAKADDFRKSIASAGYAYQDTSNIEDAFAAKNNNLAATLDKISKKFADAANSKGFQIAITAIAGAITLLIGNLPTLVTILSVLAAGWAVNNREMLLLRGQVLLYNAGILLQRVALAGLTILQGAYNAMLALYTGAANGATIATTLLGNAMRLLPLGLILTLLAVVAASFKAFGSAVTGTTAQLRAQAIQQQLIAEIQKRVADATTEQISNIESHVIALRSEGVSLETKKKLLSDLIAQSPEYLSSLTLANIATQEGKNLLDKYIGSLREKAAVEAAQSIRADKLKEDIQLSLLQQKLETQVATGKNTGLSDLTDEEKQFVTNARKNFSFTASVTDLLTGSSAAREAVDAIKAQRALITTELDQTDELIKNKYIAIGKTGTKAATTVVDGTGEKTLGELKKELKNIKAQIDQTNLSSEQLAILQAKRDELQKKINEIEGKKTIVKASKLTGTQRDDIKDIDAKRDQELSSEKLNYAEKKTDEETYLKNSLEINQKAIAAKLKLLNDSNAEERKQAADLSVEKIDNEVETDKKLFDLREKSLKEQFDQAKLAAERQFDTINNNSLATPGEKAQAKLNEDNLLLAAQDKYFAGMDALEKKYNLKSKENDEARQEAHRKLVNAIIKDDTDVSLSILDDIDRAAENEIAVIKAKYDKLKAEILNSNKSPNDKKASLDLLGKVEDVEVGTKRFEAAMNKVNAAVALLKSNKISPKGFTDIYDAAIKGQEDLNKAIQDGSKDINSFQGLLQYKLGKLLNLDEGSDKSKLLAATIADAFDTANNAQNAYYESEKANIDASNKRTQEKLKLELDQAKARAGSQVERDRLDKEYAAKSDAVNREAFEKNKKLQIAQAEVNLATQLSNLAVIAFAPNPLNIATLGAFGTVMYSIQAGLALVNFALNVGRIKRAQYEYGGNPDLTTTRGGRVKGRSHSQGGNPIIFKGRVIEDEVDELNIIRTKNAPAGGRYTMSGSFTEIASMLNTIGGGDSFMPGGMLHNLQNSKITKFAYGGNLGANLKAPVFVPSGRQSSDIIDAIEKQSEALKEHADAVQQQTVAINSRIDRIEVQQVTSTVTDAQKKQVKQRSIGIL